MEANAQALQYFIRGARIADLVDPAAFRVTIQPYVYDNRGSKSFDCRILPRARSH